MFSSVLRSSAIPALLSLLLLADCGYVGPVLPPSPQLPQAITDLKVIERGDQIVADFTTPPRTTDNMPVKKFSDIDLRIGPSRTPFDFSTWADSATQYEIQTPPPGDPENPVAIAISKKIPAKEWVGKRVAVAVRTAIRTNDHYSSWSNRVLLDVVPPLTAPQVKAESTAKGVLLSWQPERPDLEFRIYRRGATDTAPAQIGTSKTPDYVDTTSQYQTPYEYTVVAAHGLAESLPSAPEPITTKDIFPPSVPASITALAAPNSIELSWQRSPEPDLKGYYVYRSVNGGSYATVGGLVTLPGFSDHDVQHGKTYTYQVSAIDQKNNQSDRSATAQVVY